MKAMEPIIISGPIPPNNEVCRITQNLKEEREGKDNPSPICGCHLLKYNRSVFQPRVAVRQIKQYNFCVNVISYLVTYSTAQHPLNNCDRPLMRVSLSDSILVTLIFY